LRFVSRSALLRYCVSGEQSHTDFGNMK
jgi:hypothetical protein